MYHEVIIHFKRVSWLPTVLMCLIHRFYCRKNSGNQTYIIIVLNKTLLLYKNQSSPAICQPEHKVVITFTSMLKTTTYIITNIKYNLIEKSFNKKQSKFLQKNYEFIHSCCNSNIGSPFVFWNWHSTIMETFNDIACTSARF